MASPALSPQQRIGAYVLLERLGSGGIGEVWKARDPRLNRIVAIKFISAVREGSSSTRDLLREARAASVLNHPNIVTIFEVGESDRGTYLAMEFVEGETLRARLQRGAVPLPESLEIAAQIAGGLAAAHRHAIIHRDLKPENVILRVDGLVKLVDFGLAKVLPWSQDQDATRTAGGATETGQLIGTFHYMSPEQARGKELTPATDIFSFGIVLHEMVSGRHPFLAETTLDTLNAILTHPPPALKESGADAPPDLAEVLDRSLAKEPAQRFPSGIELAERLTLLRRQSERSRTLAPAPLVRQQPRWLRYLGIAVIAILIALGAIGLWPQTNGARSHVTSLAVVDLRTASDDSQAATLVQSLPEELGAALARSGFRVTSRSTVLALGSAGDVRSVGAQLGVDAVLEGSVRSHGQKLRIHLELVNTRTGFQLWNGTFMADAAELAVSDGAVAGRIAAKMKAELGDSVPE